MKKKSLTKLLDSIKLEDFKPVPRPNLKRRPRKSILETVRRKR